MTKTIMPWVKPLGLSSSNFSGRPEGADPLVWGLKNGVIDANEYLQWASEQYQLPAIKAEFFSLAVDFTLVEKYRNLYNWHSTCYPIYKWEDTLYVACLEPPKGPIDMKTCFVIAPFHALESAWQRYANSRPGVMPATEQMPIVPEAPAVDSTATKSQAHNPGFGDMTATEVLPENHQVQNPAAPRQGQQQNEAPIFKTAELAEASTLETPQATEPATVETAPVRDSPVATPTPAASEAPIADLGGLDFGDLKQEMGVSDTQPTPTSTEKSAESQASEGVGELDFSAMGEQALAGQAPAPAAEEAQENSADEPHEQTKTQLDSDLNNLTSATQTLHTPQQTVTGGAEANKTEALPFDNMTIKGISLEGEHTEVEPPKEDETRLSPASQQTPPATSLKPTAPTTPPAGVIVPPAPETPVSPREPALVNAPMLPPPHPPLAPETSDELLPSLDDLKQHQTENPQKAPGLEDSSLSLEKENAQKDSDDDYTPVPILTKAQQEAQERRKQEARLQEMQQEKSRISENTITDHAQPILIPEFNLITDDDIMKNVDIEDAQSLKGLMAHIFGHLRRDYDKLMWVEREASEHYFTTYVYGDWKITELAWKMHVNLTHPNIFRIAYRSGNPFHGQISPSPHNSKYFEWWARGKMPDIATIFPVSINDTLIGFICGFGRNKEFDEVGSLKKMENLITICKKAFQTHAAKKAA